MPAGSRAQPSETAPNANPAAEENIAPSAAETPIESSGQSVSLNRGDRINLSTGQVERADASPGETYEQAAYMSRFKKFSDFYDFVTANRDNLKEKDKSFYRFSTQDNVAIDVSFQLENIQQALGIVKDEGERAYSETYYQDDGENKQSRLTGSNSSVENRAEVGAMDNDNVTGRAWPKDFPSVKR